MTLKSCLTVKSCLTLQYFFLLGTFNFNVQSTLFLNKPFLVKNFVETRNFMLGDNFCYLSFGTSFFTSSKYLYLLRLCPQQCLASVDSGITRPLSRDGGVMDGVMVQAVGKSSMA